MMGPQRSKKRRSAVEVLAKRIDELDAPLPVDTGPGKERTVCALLGHCADVLSRHTDVFMDHEAGAEVTIDPMSADAMMSRSRLLSDISRYEPSLTQAPLDSHRQHWLELGGSKSSFEREAPREERFVRPGASRGKGVSVQPHGVGLYTSTATQTGCSMWRMYLEPFRGSLLYPLPWRSWQMQLGTDHIDVAEIVSATRWAEFVDAYAIRGRGITYPDWVRIARDFDAVHFTLPAIAAAQGFHFRTRAGLVRPAFWDVETTLWLKWQFCNASLVEVVGADDAMPH
jgi:hypothetical protein